MSTVIERVKRQLDGAETLVLRTAVVPKDDLRALIELAESYQCGHDYHADDDSGDNCRLCNASRAVFDEQEPKP